MSPVQRTVVGCRRLEEPQPTFADIGKRLGVTRARAQYLHSLAQRRVRGAAGAEAPFAATVLKSRLGHVVADDAMRERLDEVLGRDGGLTGHLLRQELLQRMGYVLKRGLHLDGEARELIGTLRAHARDHADDAGLVDESELMALLPGPAWREDVQVLLGQAGLHRVHGRIAVRRIVKAIVKAALLSIGKPATRDAIAGVCGLTGIQTTSVLCSLPSVVRATKDRWALNDWVAGAYMGIPKEIMRRIREDGGATTIERVLTEIPARFGVTAKSVRTYVQTPRFLVRNGRVSLADERSVKLRPLDEAAHGRDPDGAPYWTFRVHERYLQGFSVMGLPPEFAKLLGCEPQRGILVRIHNLPECRELSVHWRLASNSGASVGHIADALRALGIGPGDYARITLKGPGVVELAAADGTVAPGKFGMRQLNYDLKRLQHGATDGSYGTRTGRSFALAQMANTLHELGYRRLRATGLKGKHVEALVRDWKDRGLSLGTVKNRMAHLRWWANRIGKPNLIRPDNASYGIGERKYVTNEDKGTELPPEKLALVKDAHVRMALRLEEAFGLRREGGDQVLAVVLGPGREDRAEGVDHQGRAVAGDPGAERQPAATARRGAGVRGRRRDDRRPQEL